MSYNIREIIFIPLWILWIVMWPVIFVGSFMLRDGLSPDFTGTIQFLLIFAAVIWSWGALGVVIHKLVD